MAGAIGQVRGMQEGSPSSPLVDPERAALPIDDHREEIIALLHAHPVVIVCGETGSGKTTRLPRMALDAGRGARGAIAHTQPRRLAARSVAARIAAESGTELGTLVGYQVRFDSKASERTRIRLMTDGILLAELAGDPWLQRYDTIIIDEAHERSLNVDLLLGALRRIVDRRRDLRVIVTSATIEPARFSEHFGGAPIVEVSGRLFPIEINHRDPEQGDVDDPASPEVVAPAVLEALDRTPGGDVLVFLPGEREIAECHEALGPQLERRGVTIWRLSASLPAEAQDRVLRPTGPRRVILSTNVAETSLTVPRIRAVVDSGVARLRRYSSRARVERLLVEPISIASAAQRAGRCGRIGPGLCIRLYTEASLAERSAQTTPEILRSNLAGVVLRMKASGLGDPESFPFIDPPAARLWHDGLDTLVELGAISRRGELAPIGRRMALLPIDPRTSRMLLAARESECLPEVLPIAAALSVQNPITVAAASRHSSRPASAGMAEARGGVPHGKDVPAPKVEPGVDAVDGPAPDEATTAIRLLARVRHPDSDFLTLLRLWHEVMLAKRTMGSNAFSRWCREEGLAPRRVREWIEVHDQLARLEVDSWRRRRRRPNRADSGPKAPSARAASAANTPSAANAAGAASDANPANATGPASAASAARAPNDHAVPRPLPPQRESEIHRAVIAGFVSQIGRRQDDGTYAGVTGAAFVIHRDSVLARRSPTWIVASEVVDIGRRSARMVARIQADWVERVAPHMVKRQASEPHYLPESGHVAAWEKVVLGALVLTARRRVPYEPIDPEGARQVFIHAALVEEQLRGGAAFLEHNRALRQRLEAVEHKRREHGLLVDVEARFAFYDARVPRSVVNAPSFNSWRRRVEARQPETLFMSERDLLRAPIDTSAYPDTLATTAGELPLRYEHAPGAGADGVTMQVPLGALRTLDGERMEWLVPGMLQSKIEALLRTLPKRLRVRFSPAREVAAGATEHFASIEGKGSLRRALAAYLSELGGLPVEPTDFSLDALSPEFAMRFEVIDEEQRVLDSGRNLAELQQRWAGAAERRFAERAKEVSASIACSGRVAWDFPPLPEQVDLGPQVGVAYPAVVDEGSTVGVQLFPSIDEAASAMRLGLRRLALADLGSAIDHHLTFHAQWKEIESLWQALEPASTALASLRGVVAELAVTAPPEPRSAEAFDVRVTDAAPKVHQLADRVARAALRLLRARAALEARLAAASPAEWQLAKESVADALRSNAVPFPSTEPLDEIERRGELLDAALRRWERLPRGGVQRDHDLSAHLVTWLHRRAAVLAAHPSGAARHGEAVQFAREVEQLRIRVWAEGAPPRASVLERLEALWAKLG
ncbi:MAG: DUF3418 domain-containing protein [Phycisphaeraceae bacterium]|nr:DUF3418 domain-containing protein [Phycisphaeraceae bacterium]